MRWAKRRRIEEEIEERQYLVRIHGGGGRKREKQKSSNWEENGSSAEGSEGEGGVFMLEFQHFALCSPFFFFFLPTVDLVSFWG